MRPFKYFRRLFSKKVPPPLQLCSCGSPIFPGDTGRGKGNCVEVKHWRKKKRKLYLCCECKSLYAYRWNEFIKAVGTLHPRLEIGLLHGEVIGFEKKGDTGDFNHLIVNFPRGGTIFGNGRIYIDGGLWAPFLDKAFKERIKYFSIYSAGGFQGELIMSLITNPLKAGLARDTTRDDQA